MADEDRPAMPWYVKDWIASEDRARMTYEARGVYRDLLDYSWLHRGLPVDHAIIANWLGIPARKFALVWGMIAACWQEVDGRYVNRKQEEVRQDLDAYRVRKQEAGRTGGKRRAERQAEAKQKSSSASSKPLADAKQNASRDPSKPLAEVKPAFASSSSSSKDPTNEDLMVGSTPSVARVASPPPPLIRSPLDYAKAMSRCAFVGQRLEVPNKLHADFRRLLGGADPDTALLDWYAEVDAEITTSREAIVPDVFPWLQARFKTWAQSRIGDAEMAKFLEAAR